MFTICLWKSTACYSFGRIWILRKFSSKPASTLFSLWHMFLLRSKNCCCCCSVANLCPTLCNPMDCSMTGFPVPHHLQEFAQVHDHWISDTIQPSHPVTCFSSCPPSFPAPGSYLMSWLFSSDGQSIGASASASVLPMSIQDWFPLGLTGLISLLSKGLSRVISSTTIWNHHIFSVLSLLYGPTLTSIHEKQGMHSLLLLNCA